MTTAPPTISIAAQGEHALLRLCQLVSPAMPVGAYHFSQGLEYAAHAGWVHDEASVFDWIAGVAQNALGTLDLPILLRLQRAWENEESKTVRAWSLRLLAARETQELRAEERHLGRALAKVLVELDIAPAHAWVQDEAVSYAAMFSLAAAQWRIDSMQAAQGYLWAWSENQVLAALKLLPFGQSAGQRVLNKILQQIPAIVAHAASLDDDAIGVSTPLHGMASSLHENQYSRLFKS